MRFEKTLKNSIYEPWQSKYIDYTKLKKLLRENDSSHEDEAQDWTEEDEGAFVDELVNVQLEKVNAFQVNTYKQLRDRTSACESRLEKLVVPEGQQPQDGQEKDEGNQDEALDDSLNELDSITKETNELEKFSRINFTGFLKAAKKHDRRRGSNYRIRPLLQVRLAALPFNAEDYSPLLYRLSAMYSFVRQKKDGDPTRSLSFAEAQLSGDTYRSYKFWVHPENLLEVKTYILRRLPVLVYNPQTSKIVEGSQNDPTITSLYFDNPKFSLYTNKLDKASIASSLRLRWFGQLNEKPEILLEKKTIKENDDNEQIRFPIKEKHIQSFINGDYKLEKSVQKLRARQGNEAEEVKQLETSIDEIQKFIRENELQPVLRANYTRTAFQIPGDDRVRISLDTNLALIREDSLDVDRPCRDPEDWHRRDIDDNSMEFPFTQVRKGELSKFPYALLEIKVRNGAKKRTNEWVEELMSSHLVTETPRFSKFLHGIAQLFEDYVNSFPFWLSQLETDIRKDPETAFQEEQDKKAKRAEDEFAVGSFMGSKSGSSPFRAAIGSPVGKSSMRQAAKDDENIEQGSRKKAVPRSGPDDVAQEDDSDGDGPQADRAATTTTTGLRSLFASFSTSKYARAHRQGKVHLPPGVREPGQLIKDSGPVRVEPKVWLANERTFFKYQHVSILLAALSLGLYNAAGENNNVARALAVVYTLIAVFAGAWGWYMYLVRSKMIEQRSGKDFDNVLGPVIICVSLVVALCLNFGFKYRAAVAAQDLSPSYNFTGGVVGQSVIIPRRGLR